MSLVINKTLSVKSPAFSNNDFIPSNYSCEGSNINPELTISEIPKDARSLALIMDDPDAPKGTFDHWVMWNIPVTEKISENSVPGAQGKNGKNENKYTGPCPPSGTHHYHFKIYALDTKLDLPISTDKKALLKAMEGHIIGSGELIGLYKK
jgi:Raf kinase inhibitor-like YbhB/YbcL family protein